MFLAIDVGNSTIACKFFGENEEYYSPVKTSSDYNISESKLKKTFLKATSDKDISGCIVGSVVKELNDKIKNVIKSTFNIEPIFVTSDLKLGLNLKVKNPQDVGADRIANACAAKDQFPTPAIIVDAGTAVTFDVLDKNGDFVGGMIFPGIRLQTDALCNGTSLLPNVGTEEFKSYIQDETEYEIITGVVGGVASAIDGLIKRCTKELGEKPSVILTGGNSSYLEMYMEYPLDSLNEEHTLEGLAKIYRLNAK